MRLVLAVAVLAAAPFAAACEEEYEPPKTASDEIVPQREYAYGRGPAVPPQVIYVQAPPPDRRPMQERSDPVWQTETYYVSPPSSEYYVPPPHPIPRHTISLGYIGDWPLWSGGDPPPAPWWRPFPPEWERSYHSYGRSGGFRRWR